MVQQLASYTAVAVTKLTELAKSEGSESMVRGGL